MSSYLRLLRLRERKTAGAGPATGSGLLLEGDTADDAEDFITFDGDQATGFLLLEGDAA